MKALKITGGKKLSGTIRIGGDKNSCVALIPAAILSDDEVTICNVPEITDVDALSEILKLLKCDVKCASESIVINSKNMENVEIPEEYSKKLRASYYFMGALLAKYKEVTMYFPGGCSIGARPIDLHLKGFEAMGANIEVDGNRYHIKAEELKGASIYLDIVSVGATLNIMIAATKAKGITTIENAAKEPQIVNVATLLNNMGAKITGAGTSTIKIEGVENLDGCFHEVIPDRIEAGTYMIAGALCGKDLKIDNIIPEHVEALTAKLKDMGVDVSSGPDYLVINAKENYKPVNIRTAPYPGFVTDWQQLFTIPLIYANGRSTIEETIWENRFMHVPYLNDMGANIEVIDDMAIIHGPTTLRGTEVVSTDLRGGAAMVLAGLIAEGETTVTNVDHILRGYERIVEKLTDVGAKIEYIEI